MAASKKQKADPERYFVNPFVDSVQNGDEKEILNEEIRKSIENTRDQYLQLIVQKVPMTNGDYSVYTGISGLALLCLKLYHRTENTTLKAKYLDLAKECITLGLAGIKADKRNKSRVTFIEGHSGPLALGAIIYSMHGKTSESQKCQEDMKPYLDKVLSPSFDSNELLYGRVGYLYSLLFVKHHMKDKTMDWINEAIPKVAKCILEQGKLINLGSPLMYEWHEKTYLAAAHGVSGILYVLMDVPHLLEDDKIKKDIIGTIDFIIGLRLKSGNYPTRVDGSSDDLVQWCHGAPAMALLFCKAYEVFKDSKYLTAAEDASKEIWKRGLLRKGMGLCHGSSGNGYALLRIYEITKNTKYLSQAVLFASWTWKEGKSTLEKPDNPYSLFEGISGAVSFLTDLATLPKRVHFPAYDLDF